MYKGKPVVVTPRPWYRHPIFPWGYYSLVNDKIDRQFIQVDGYNIPGDGCTTLYERRITNE